MRNPDLPDIVFPVISKYGVWEPQQGREAPAIEPTGLSFGAALDSIKKGRGIARRGWNGKGLWLSLQKPDVGSKMTLPYIYLNTDTDRIPWTASQTDVLADDWFIVANK